MAAPSCPQCGQISNVIPCHICNAVPIFDCGCAEVCQHCNAACCNTCSIKIDFCSNCTQTMCPNATIQAYGADSVCAECFADDLRFSGKVEEKPIIGCPEAQSPRPPPTNCSSVFQAFVPQIHCVPYRDATTFRKANPAFQKHQAEHFIPNSCFMKGSRKQAITLGSAVGQYTEDEAMTYFIYDDQSRGTEHKWLTDRERLFCKELEKRGENATVTQWLNYMEQETADMLATNLWERTQGGGPGLRVTNKSLSKDAVYDLAKQAAYCIRYQTEQKFVQMNVNLNAHLKNGMIKGAKLPAHPPVKKNNVPF